MAGDAQALSPATFTPAVLVPFLRAEEEGELVLPSV
jgi:hypothetical protein